jgi:hypothetical protein
MTFEMLRDIARSETEQRPPVKQIQPGTGMGNDRMDLRVFLIINRERGSSQVDSHGISGALNFLLTDLTG